MTMLAEHALAGHGTCGEGTALLGRGGRRYLYIANEKGPVNFSVLDVTDPRTPELLTQTRLPHDGVRSNSLAIGSPAGAGTAGGELLLVAYQVSTPGAQPAGIEIFDLADPASPRPLTATRRKLGWRRSSRAASSPA